MGVEEVSFTLVSVLPAAPGKLDEKEGGELCIQGRSAQFQWR